MVFSEHTECDTINFAAADWLRRLLFRSTKSQNVDHFKSFSSVFLPTTFKQTSPPHFLIGFVSVFWGLDQSQTHFMQSANWRRTFIRNPALVDLFFQFIPGIVDSVALAGINEFLTCTLPNSQRGVLQILFWNCGRRANWFFSDLHVGGHQWWRDQYGRWTAGGHKVTYDIVDASTRRRHATSCIHTRVDR